MRKVVYGFRPFKFTLTLNPKLFFLLCNIFIYIIEPIRIMFIPVSMDEGIGIVSSIALAFVFLEIFLEVCIRPSTYSEIQRTDVAYESVNARFITQMRWVALRTR